MNHYGRFKKTLTTHTFLAIMLPGLVGLGTYIGVREYLELSMIVSCLISLALFAVATIVSHIGLLSTSSRPLEMIWQAIWHVSPDKSNVPPPKVDTLRAGRELVSAMVMQVYDIASKQGGLLPTSSNKIEPPSVPTTDSTSLLETIPLAIFVLDSEGLVRATNTAAATYVGLSKDNVIGKPIHDNLHMSFSSSETLESWLKETKESKAVDSKSWEHVKLDTADGKVKQFDLAASYSKDSPSGNEVVLALFDRSAAYHTQDQATSYVALAVHELRTPLTMLRGYIEMFEDELGEDLSAEHQDFMRKMSASAQSLTAFVSNILNVARVDENQLTLTLHEANWNEVLPEIVKDLELRAQVRGKNIKLNIQENLPTVAIDKISMSEVVSNLVENSIKYSGQSNDIIIHATLGKNGTVDTVVQDFGLGIPESAMGGLFTKYYRSHRSKNAVSGNGLGLYLVKSLIVAHGGNVWAQSKEGEGSSFGFSIQQYANVKDKPPGQDGIERQASGWIKNHSLYRR